MRNRLQALLHGALSTVYTVVPFWLVLSLYEVARHTYPQISPQGRITLYVYTMVLLSVAAPTVYWLLKRKWLASLGALGGGVVLTVVCALVATTLTCLLGVCLD